MRAGRLPEIRRSVRDLMWTGNGTDKDAERVGSYSTSA